MKIVVGDATKLFVMMGSHQGSALRPYLFILVMNELTNKIQDEVPWCMLFVDNIVLIDETSKVSIKNLSYGETP